MIVNVVEICRQHHIRRLFLQKLGLRLLSKVVEMGEYGREIWFEDVRLGESFGILEAFLCPECVLTEANKIRQRYIQKFDWTSELLYIE